MGGCVLAHGDHGRSIVARIRVYNTLRRIDSFALRTTYFRGRTVTLAFKVGCLAGNRRPYDCNPCRIRLRGGETGIRTPDRLLTYTRFPGVRLKPLIHLSGGEPNYSKLHASRH